MSIKYVTIIHDLCQDFNCFASDNEIIIAKIYNTAAKFRELMHHKYYCKCAIVTKA